MIFDRNLTILLLFTFIGYALSRIYVYFIRPKLIEKTTKIIEKNPNWITPKLRLDYYGFGDIDIILAENTIMLNVFPRFHMSNEGRYELLISNDTSTREIDTIAQLALLGKMKIKYNVFYPEKPVYWLSILCYMLDGGDIKEADTSWEKR